MAWSSNREFLGAVDVRTLEPLDEGSVFRVGSVAKLVTALTVLDLVAKGAVDLSAALSHYVPGAPTGFDATVGELLLHRSGLPKDLPGRRGASMLPGTLADAAAGLKAAWPAGERAEYSNLLLEWPRGHDRLARGQHTRFHRRLMAAAEGSAAVVLLAATTPAPKLRAAAGELVGALRAGGAWSS